MGILLLFAALLHRNRNYPFYDPDRYYHLAISRMTAEEGLLRRLPQVEDLGWGRAFPEKEFLFHAVTSLAYRLGGERASAAIAPVLGFVFLITLLLILRPLAPPAWVAYAVAFPVLLAPSFLVRMMILRPHVLAVTCFLWAFHGLATRRSLVTFAACAAYALAYHAFYVPLALCALGAAVHWPAERQGRRVWRSPEVAGLLGLLAGTFTNPYFPANLSMGWLTLRVALSFAARPDIGQELRPLPVAEFVLSYWFHLLVVGAGAVCLRRAWADRRRERVQVRRLALALVGCGAFWALAARSPRASEYAIPLTAVLAAHLYPEVPPRGRTGFAVAAVLAGLLMVPRAWPVYSQSVPFPNRVTDAFAAIDTIPLAPVGAKVLNCAFASSPFLLYRRPDLRFVDILDPTLLWVAAPELSDLRTALRAGRVPDPYPVVQGSFRASYVFCSDPALYARLMQDARFVKLYPRAGGFPNDRRALDLFYVFALAREADLSLAQSCARRGPHLERHDQRPDPAA